MGCCAAIGYLCILEVRSAIRIGVNPGVGIDAYRLFDLLFEPLDRMASVPGKLYMVTRAITVSSLMYASPAWWGFTDASERSGLNRLIAGLMWAGFLTSPHSRNWFAKLMLAYSEQYAQIQIMSSGIISLLKNHPAVAVLHRG